MQVLLRRSIFPTTSLLPIELTSLISFSLSTTSSTRPISLPSQLTPTQLFEPPSLSEYRSIPVSTLDSTGEGPKNYEESLVGFIQRGEHAKAEELRANLRELGVDLSGREEFGQHALELLEKGDERWIEWYEMTLDHPPRWSVHYHTKIYKSLRTTSTHIIDFLLSSAPTPTTIRFAKVAIRKGHYQPLARTYFPHLIKHGHARHAEELWELIERKYLDDIDLTSSYDLSSIGNTEKILAKIKSTTNRFRHYRGEMIKLYLLSPSHHSLVANILSASSTRISNPIYLLTLLHLAKSDEMGLFEGVWNALAERGLGLVRKEDMGRVKVGLTRRQGPREGFGEDFIVVSSPPMEDPTLQVGLEEAFATLRHSSPTPPPLSSQPPPLTSTKNSTTVFDSAKILSMKGVKRSTKSYWASLAMRLSIRPGTEGEEVRRVFGEWFDVALLPEIVRNILRLRDGWGVGTAKLIPSTAALHILLHSSLPLLVRTPSSLFNEFYTALISPNLLLTPSLTRNFSKSVLDSSIFVIILKALLWRGEGMDELWRVVADMRRLRVEIGKECWGVVLGHLATTGDSDLTALLDWFDNPSILRQPEFVDSLSPPLRAILTDFPSSYAPNPLDIIAYTNVLTRLRKRGETEMTKDVLGRIERRRAVEEEEEGLEWDRRFEEVLEGLSRDQQRGS